MQSIKELAAEVELLERGVARVQAIEASGRSLTAEERSQIAEIVREHDLARRQEAEATLRRPMSPTELDAAAREIVRRCEREGRPMWPAEEALIERAYRAAHPGGSRR